MTRKLFAALLSILTPTLYRAAGTCESHGSGRSPVERRQTLPGVRDQRRRPGRRHPGQRGGRHCESFRAIEYLQGRRKIPFIRIWASLLRQLETLPPGSGGVTGTTWISWSRPAKKAHVGLALTLFWNAWTLPFYFNEFLSAWVDDRDSQTRRFVQQYTHENLSRATRAGRPSGSGNLPTKTTWHGTLPMP